MDVTPFSGGKIQKVGAIYTRTLEEGGAIYSENRVITPFSHWLKDSFGAVSQQNMTPRKARAWNPT
jgi:hypothetical protein